MKDERGTMNEACSAPRRNYRAGLNVIVHHSSFIVHHFALILAIGGLLPGCAGPYHVGNDTLYPADVQTVYVPMFESESFRRHLGERLTEAVVKQIETDTPFKVVSGNADSVLSGRIVSDTKRTIVENRFDDPRDTEYNLQVLVTWVNRKGDLIVNETGIAVPPALIDIGARSDIVPEFGRSVASQQQAAIDKLARQIVGLMEAPW